MADEDQDQSQVVVAPPQTSGTTYMGQPGGQPMPQRAPGVPPPNALAWARYRSTLPGLSPQQQAENDVREQVAGQPIEQQQQAVQAAVKFQAQRGYQQDLAGGMSASQAMAKWGPMLFAPGSPGAMSAMKMQQPQIRNIGGKLVRIMPNGTAQPINVPGQVAPPAKWEPQDTIDYKAASERYNKKADMLVKPGLTTDTTELRRQMNLDRWEMQRISGKYGQGAAPGGVQPPGGASKSGRVKVKDSKGKTGSIPADQVDAAKAAGYTIVQ